MTDLPLDFNATLAHLVGRVGEEVEISVGATAPQGPPLVVHIRGTLTEGWDTEVPSAEVLAFAVDQSEFFLDSTRFDGAKASGRYLLVSMGTIALEVNAPAEPE